MFINANDFKIIYPVSSIKTTGSICFGLDVLGEGEGFELPSIGLVELALELHPLETEGMEEALE